jgi:stress response protein SCP2
MTFEKRLNNANYGDTMASVVKPGAKLGRGAMDASVLNLDNQNMAENDIKAQFFNAKANSKNVVDGFEASQWK